MSYYPGPNGPGSDPNGQYAYPVPLRPYNHGYGDEYGGSQALQDSQYGIDSSYPQAPFAGTYSTQQQQPPPSWNYAPSGQFGTPGNHPPTYQGSQYQAIPPIQTTYIPTLPDPGNPGIGGSSNQPFVPWPSYTPHLTNASLLQSSYAYQQPLGQDNAPASSWEPQSFGAALTGQTPYQYSSWQCRRKALLIGINYGDCWADSRFGTLKGCHNDVNRVRAFLKSNGFTDIVVLADDTGRASHLLPTRANILREMERLVQNAQPRDSLFFHYSGHGDQKEAETDQGEVDGMDEYIIPCDHKYLPWDQRYIDDNTMHEIMVKRLPQGARLTAIFDSCHSGTALDLPYIYNRDGVEKVSHKRYALHSALRSVRHGNWRQGLGHITHARSDYAERQEAERIMQRTKTELADVIMLSGTKDEGEAMQMNVDGEMLGAMSTAFIHVCRSTINPTYRELLNGIRDYLINRGRTQRPQLSCCHPLDTNLRFVL